MTVTLRNGSPRSEWLDRYPFPQVIDNTMLDSWRNCNHSFFRAHVQGLRLAETGEPGSEPTFRKSIHLHFGGCYARGLEVTRKMWAAGAGELEALTAGANAVIQMWDSEHNLPEPRTRTEEAKTLANCLLAHARNFAEWPLDDPNYQTATVAGEPLVENSGAAPIIGTRHPVSGEPILYAGRFDAVLNRNGVLWGLDDKTTGSNVEGDNWQAQWRLRSQFTGYCWLAQQWGYNIEWFLIHGCQVLKTKCNFAEAVEVRPTWMIDRWYAQLVRDINRMIEQWHDFLAISGNPPAVAHAFDQKLNEACFHYNSPCAYLRLCEQPLPEDFEDSYIIHRWDPLERSIAE